jgi:hypothetical protein
VRRVTRARFLRRAAFAGAAAALAPARAAAQFTSPTSEDETALDLVLVLERLQVTLYEEALALDLGGDLRSLVQAFADQEAEHTTLLTQAVRDLGRRPEVRSRFRFGFDGRDGFLTRAAAVEDLVVGAYAGAIPAAPDAGVRAVLSAVAHVEAEQASTLRLLTGDDATPVALEPVLSRTTVTERIQPFVTV